VEVGKCVERLPSGRDGSGWSLLGAALDLGSFERRRRRRRRREEEEGGGTERG